MKNVWGKIPIFISLIRSIINLRTGGFSLGVKLPRGVKLTTHLRLVLRLRRCGVIPPLLHKYSRRGAYLSTRYVFMA